MSPSRSCIVSSTMYHNTHRIAAKTCYKYMSDIYTEASRIGSGFSKSVLKQYLHAHYKIEMLNASKSLQIFFTSTLSWSCTVVSQSSFAFFAQKMIFRFSEMSSGMILVWTSFFASPLEDSLSDKFQIINSTRTSKCILMQHFKYFPSLTLELLF